MRLGPRLFLVLSCTLLPPLLSCTPSVTPTFGDWRPPIAASPEIARLEAEMWARLNRDRGGAGLGQLRWDARLADIARAHSLDMRQHDFFAHESPSTGVLEDRLIRGGYLAYEMRENLAIAGDVERAEDNLLQSPGHYANIMAPAVTTIGIGIVLGGIHGEAGGLTITQVFARPARLETPAEALVSAGHAIARARTAAGLPPPPSQPLLTDLAREHVAEVDDCNPSRTLGAIAKAASSRLADERGHGIHGIQLLAEVVFTGDELDVAGSVASARSYGLAVAPARDDKGRPRVKVLVLFGE